jgi:steroid delta-isomerase-like uncharacterized protein
MPSVTAQHRPVPPWRPPVTKPARKSGQRIDDPATHLRVMEIVMKTCNLLLSAVAALAALAGVVPCGANASDGVRTDSLELNKSITRRVYEEGLSQGRFDVPYTTDFVGHGGRNTFTHADGMAEAKGWREAFPDLAITVEKQVAENDLVAVHWTARGSNTGSGNGLPATGRAVEITGTTLFRLDDGRIAEEWTCANSLGLMKQLGLVETTTAAAAARKTPAR